VVAGDGPDTAAAYLASTSEAPEHGGLWRHLVETDGSGPEPGTAAANGRVQLRIKAARNPFGRRQPPPGPRLA
jgi:hypothetical protein